MEKMLGNMLKTMGFDPEKIEGFIVLATNDIQAFGGALKRIEENQTEILSRLERIEAQLVGEH